MAVLFTHTDLTDHLHQRVTVEAAYAAERLVWGWLKPVLGLAERPDPVPDEVFSWAIELGGIAHENPAGLSSQQLGSLQRSFSVERRAQILAEAGAGASHGSTSSAPRGSFPAAQPWPDPARAGW